MLNRWGPHESPMSRSPGGFYVQVGEGLELAGESIHVVHFPAVLFSSELISGQEREAVSLLPHLVS